MEQIIERPGRQQPSGRPPSSAETVDTQGQSSLWKALFSFIGQRLLFGAAVILAIIYFTHFAFLIAQGTDFVPAIGEAVVQTVTYLGNLLQGDLGMSQPRSAAFRPQPIMDILPISLSRSLGLLGATFGLSIAIGVPLGIFAALRKRTRGALTILIVSFIGISTPVFFAALFLQIAAIQYTRAFGQSIVPVGGFGWDKHMVLPVLVLAARPVAQITRVTFVSVSEVMEMDYVRVARGKGLRFYQVLLVHIMKNSAIPILTTIAVSLRFVLSSLPVVELYFGWGGMGEVLLRALFNGDVNLTVALLTALGVLFVLINLLLEASYYAIDPRIQRGVGRRSLRSEESLLESLKALPSDIGQGLANNPISRWLQNRRSPSRGDTSPFTAILEQQGVKAADLDNGTAGRFSRWSTLRYGILGNPPFLLGMFIVGALMFLVVFGPRLAPFSPNTTQHIAIINGTLTTPPFAPSDKHPWGTDSLGRDIFSLIVSGVQQTMVLAFSVVIVRILIGFFLGVLAGWFHESWLDRLVMGVVQALAVFPTLMLAAMLIFAIGFEGGMLTFFIALSAVGWGEIVEFVRGEVMTIRPKPFIESAIAIGQSTPRLIRVHFLPNLAPGLIAVAAVEVSAVLLILGELGFIGIFIQGGASSDFGLYSQVPEWGSLLSGVRNWVRSYPWTGFYPTMAFFIAILGFNLLGEGLRRLLGRVGLVVNTLMSRYTLILVVFLVAGFFWLRSNTGELVFYRQQSDTFSGQIARQHIEQLADPAVEGQSLGTEGLNQAAEYIAGQFAALGLQRAGENLSYFQNETRTYHYLDSAPTMNLDDGGPALEYRQAFNVYPAATLNMGLTTGRVRLFIPGPDADLSGLDLSNDVVLVLSAADMDRLRDTTCAGVLLLAENLSVMKQRYTYSAVPPGQGCGEDTPVLWIDESVANRILQETGRKVDELNEEAAGLDEENIDLSTSVTATFEIPGVVRESVPVVNVIGHLPGTSDALDGNLIIVATQYDNAPVGPDGVYPAANGNASGVAVMLEAIRALQESGYVPFKTFLFVAYSGEGIPSGEAGDGALPLLPPAPPVSRFLEARTGFDTAFEVEAVIYLRGLGAGGEALEITTEDRNDVSKLMSTAAQLKDVDTERANGSPTLNVFVPGFNLLPHDESIQQVGIARQGWSKSAHLPNDNLTFITEENLENAGRGVTLGLMILGRDQNY